MAREDAMQQQDESEFQTWWQERAWALPRPTPAGLSTGSFTGGGHAIGFGLRRTVEANGPADRPVTRMATRRDQES